jgi:AraC-like DNA-binding protein
MLITRDLFDRLCAARDLLGEVRESSPSIPQIAAHVGISPFHFIRQFEALFGTTPHRFRVDSRLRQAQLLLARGHHSVTEVCMEVGFTSLGSFSSLFSRRVGVSPGSYQRHARVLIHVPAFVPGSLFPGCLTLMEGLPASAFRNFREAQPGAHR